MSVQKSMRHFAAVCVRAFRLWPLIARTGLYNHVRRKKYPDTLPFLDVVITECCTLKCRNCSNLMQYYHEPENLDPDEVISSLKRILTSLRVCRLKILGGEPFVCQKVLVRVLGYLRNESEDRYDTIEIITNGTIVPSDECIHAMKDTPRLKVIFSNYGELSSKLIEFCEICKCEGIDYEVVEDDYWWDFGDVKFREEEEERKTQHRYDGCYSRRLCTTLYRGSLYVCPRQAHAIHLGLIPEEASECVNILKPEYEDLKAMREAVYGLIDRKERITTCSYCGCDVGTKVPRALQTERPLDVI